MTQQHEPHVAASARSVAARVAATERSESGRAMSDGTRHVIQRSMVGVDHASIMGVELMAAILVWTGIGYLMDGWLGTTPWLLVVGGLVGNAAGIYLIWIRSGHMEAAERRAGTARRESSLARHDAAVGHIAPEGRLGDR